MTSAVADERQSAVDDSAHASQKRVGLASAVSTSSSYFRNRIAGTSSEPLGLAPWCKELQRLLAAENDFRFSVHLLHGALAALDSPLGRFFVSPVALPPSGHSPLHECGPKDLFPINAALVDAFFDDEAVSPWCKQVVVNIGVAWW